MQVSPSRRAAHSLSDVARQVAPHLRIVSASRPTPLLRDFNVIAYTEDAEAGRRAILALEGIEHADEQLGTVVMGFAPDEQDGTPSAESLRIDADGVDPEGVGRAVVSRIVAGGALGAVAGAVVVGLGALLLGATGWRLAGAAVAGAMMVAVFGAIWLAFAGLGGSDAYRQTFVRDDAKELTIVSVHTDDPDEAAAARDRLAADPALTLLAVSRSGDIHHDLGDRVEAAAAPPMNDRDDDDGDGDAVPGAPAPAFATPASTGKILALDDFVGTVPVALSFVGTLPERQANDLIDAFNDVFAEFGRHQLQLLVVTADGPDAVRVQRHQGTTVPLLADDDGSLLERYAASATFPATVFVDTSGTVTRVLEGGSPPDHVAAVLAAATAGVDAAAIDPDA